MNKRKNIYRGFNRRRHTKEKIIVVSICVCLIGGYTYVKLKNSEMFGNLIQKVSFLDEFKWPSLKIGKDEGEKTKDVWMSSDDVSKELDKIGKEKDDKQSEAIENKTTEDVKMAVVDGYNIYTIQVASIQDNNDIAKVETKLTEAKIPFSLVEVDGLKKVQTYSSFDKEITRGYLEKVRTIYPDAFLSELKIPVLSLEYTSKYSYVDSISKELNNLIDNFEKETKFWESSKESASMETYKEILTGRRSILEKLEKEAEKIDYSQMEIFKNNLVKYIKDTDEKIDKSSKSANEEEYYVSQSLLLSSIHGYFSFVNSIKHA